MLTALLIFIGSYALIAFQSLPRLHITRPAGALLGAVAMVVFGVLTPGEAYRAVDWNTIVFLLGAMIIVAYLEISGFFAWLRAAVLRRAKTPRQLLALVVACAGTMSAVFMNDTVCLLLAPVVLRLTEDLKLPPVPFLIALAASSNVGSACTIIGNPQNMLIAVHSGISFTSFVAALWPVSLAGLVVVYAAVRWLYRRDLSGRQFDPAPTLNPPRIRSGMFIAAAATVALFLFLLILDYPPPLAAAGCAALLILAGARRPRAALQKVDWELLLFFAGLFVITGGVEQSGLMRGVFGHFQQFFTGPKLERLAWLSEFTAAVSNLASNVPAVMLFLKLIPRLDEPRTYWLALAMSSTLAGNLTVIGSVANIIVFERARGTVAVGFREYLRVGFFITVATMLIGIGVLALQR